MAPHDDVEVHLLEEIGEHVHSEYVRNSPLIGRPADHRGVRVGPEEIAEKTCEETFTKSQKAAHQDVHHLIIPYGEAVSALSQTSPHHTTPSLTGLVHVHRPLYPPELLERAQIGRQTAVAAAIEFLTGDLSENSSVVYYVVQCILRFSKRRLRYTHQKILPSMSAATGITLKTSWKIFHSLIEYRRLPAKIDIGVRYSGSM